MRVKRFDFSILCISIVLFTVVRGSDTNVGQIAEDEDESVAFKRFEDRIVSFMKNVRRQVFPFLTRAAYDVALTPSCTRSLTRLYSDLLSLKSWALKMLDSSGKVPSGLLKGSMVMLGNYDECLEIAVPPVRSSRDPPILGRYCLTFLYVPNTLLFHLREFSAGRIQNTSSTERFKEFFDLMSRYKFDGTVIHSRFGVCIPSTCSETDLGNILKYALSDSGMTAEIRSCEVKGRHQLTVEQIIILCLFGLIIAAVIFATLFDCYFSVTEGTPEKESGHITDKRIVHVLRNFSVISNTKMLFSDDFEEEKLINIPCLRGTSVILFCFYMVVNSYAIIDEHAIRSFSSSINYFSMLKEPLFAIIANSMIFVDTLFGIAGFLLFYATCNNQISFKGRVVQSIFRYLLPLLCAICVFLLLPLFGDGPAFHEVLDVPLSACRKNWWANIFFISNFFKLEEQCMLHTWILGCLIQLLIIGFVFKWIINRWPNVGLGGLAIVTLACDVYLGIIAVQQHLPPAMSMYFIFSIPAVKRVAETIFFLPYGHMGSFAVGMFASYWIQKHPNMKITRFWKCLGRIAITALLCCLVFGLYPYHDGTEMNQGALALYSSLHGIVFGAIVSLGLVISLRADSDIVNKALSSKYFLPLRKLVYYAYLLHWAVIFFHIAISRERQYLSHYEQISRSFSHMVASFLLAFIFHILFNGVFTLDEAIALTSKDSSPENISYFKSIFARRKFQVQKPKVYEIGNDFVLQTSKYVPE